MALLEIPHLNKSAILKLMTPNLYLAAIAKCSASFNDFSLLFFANAIKRDDKVVDKISWHQKMKNGHKLQT